MQAGPFDERVRARGGQVQIIRQRVGATRPHYWTWRLLAAGFTPAECAAIRSLCRRRGARPCPARGRRRACEVDAAWFLRAESIARSKHVVGPVAPTRIRPLLAKLPRGTRYEDVQLVLKSRRASAGCT